MTRKSAIGLTLAAAIAVIVYLATSNNRGDDDADALMRRERSLSSQAPKPVEAIESIPSRWWLAAGLEAVKNTARQSWFVHRDRQSVMVQLPYPPDSEGSFPNESHSADSDPNDSSKSAGFVGAHACAPCHQDRHDSFITTAHFRTSAAADPALIKGPLDPPRNELQTTQQGLSFSILAKQDRLFQHVHYDGWETDIPMDIVTGSAKTGQTFLYWVGDALFQDYVTFATKPNEWVPSPGFTERLADYSRPIKAACLECHLTSIDPVRPPNHYDRHSIVWGISCERCHGPGQEHVEYHEQHPGLTEGKWIHDPKNLSRERQLDICGQCHSGLPTLLREPFSYRPGEDLQLHHEIREADNSGPGDIHTSNQMTRLAMSACFVQSQMTCTTCHNPHQERASEIISLTNSCNQCHQAQHCGLSETLNSHQIQQCIACHMPLSNNHDIVLRGAGGNFTMQMTDHFIRIDQAATERILAEPQP